MKTMKRISRRLLHPFRGKESGMAFTAVLAFLVLGALIITPLLGFMITGLRAGQSHESRTQEFYSADAGVERAIWELQHGGLLTDAGTWTWPTNTWTLDPFVVNGDNVTVTIENVIPAEGELFKIVSTAEDIATGSITTVTVYVTPEIKFPDPFFNNALTGLGDIKITANVDGDIVCTGNLTLIKTASTTGEIVVDGDITCVNFYNSNSGVVNGTVNACRTNSTVPWQGGLFDNPKGGVVNGDVYCNVFKNNGVIDGNVKCWSVDAKTTSAALNYGLTAGHTLQTGVKPPELPDVYSEWQDKEDLDKLYGGQVPPYPEQNPYGWPSAAVTVAGGAVGPINMGYNHLNVDASVFRDLTIDGPATVTLSGTIFVTGDLYVTQKANLDMKGQTIYVWGDVDVKPDALIIGSGSIIGVGAINFQPNMAAAGTGDDAIILHSHGVATDWTRQSSNTLNNLYGVWGTSATNLWAVGLGGTILHGDGDTWTATLTSPTSAQLNAICGFDANEIYAVGEGGVIVRYTGGTWMKVDHGLVEAYHNLHSVWCSSDNVAFAVGDEGTILRCEQNVWEIMDTIYDYDFYDVYGTSSSDVYVVGTSGAVLHYDGTAWSRLPHGMTNRDLFGVWVSPTGEVFVVGDAGTILRYADSAWEFMFISALNGGIITDLMDVWGTSADSVYAVGPLSNIIHYTGDEGNWWSREKSPTTIYTRDLHGIWVSPEGHVFTVGKAEVDYVFIMSVESTVLLYPGDNFHGAFTGKGEIELKPGSTLQSPQGIEEPNFPRIRNMKINSYIIEQG